MALLRELICLLEESSLASLRRIVIVEDQRVASTVNAIIKTVEPSVSYAPRDVDAANAVTVPVENGKDLACLIVLGKALLDSLDLEHGHPAETVSALLEELLHVWVYTSAWQRRGYVQHRGKGLDPCEADVLTIASQMCDEYVVIRRKTHLAATQPLFELEPGKRLGAGVLSYGGDAVSAIELGIGQAEDIVLEAACGARAASDAWRDVTRALYRGIFEPLSRDAAYRDGALEGPPLDQRLQSVEFYRDVLADPWNRMHEGLRRVFDSNLSESEVILDQIVSCLRAFLKIIGVTYRKTDAGLCWVDFSSSFFEKWLQTHGAH
jgi:hypothetical protein